jgi:acyl-CoA reductase-like NAD-dependent aldehyde dehydrogenase
VLPTVVTDVAPDSALASEEQFGPVLPIFGYDDIEDAVAAANAIEFGLTAAAWGSRVLGASSVSTGSERSRRLGVTSASPRRSRKHAIPRVNIC